MTPEKTYSKRKTILLSVVSVILGFLVLELMVRGAFIFTGRYETWGYPKQNKFVLPYVGFFNRPDSGRDRYGFRLDGSDNPDRNLENKNECEFRIFILGGSTVAGRELKSKDGTLPARVERLLNKIGFAGTYFSVINGGVGGHVSPQSLMQDIMYVRYSLQPDLIVHFDGSNDSVGHSAVYPEGRLFGIKDNLHRHTEQVFSSIERSRSVQGILDITLRLLSEYSALVFLIDKTVTDPNSWDRYLNRFGIGQIVASDLNTWVTRHANRYMFNISIALSLGSRDTGVAYFFQPTLLPHLVGSVSDAEVQYLNTGLDSKETFHGHDRRVAKIKFYKMVSQIIKERKKDYDTEYSLISDLSELFQRKQSSETFYSDHVHYSSKGREVISVAMVEKLAPLIKRQIKLQERFVSCAVE